VVERICACRKVNLNLDFGFTRLKSDMTYVMFLEVVKLIEINGTSILIGATETLIIFGLLVGYLAFRLLVHSRKNS